MARLAHVNRRILILVLVAAGVVGSLAFYRIHTPPAENQALLDRAGAYSNQAPLNGPQISVLTQYSDALVALAKRVEPAVVEIHVTSKVSASPNPMQQFFGQFFGQFPQQMQPHVEYGIGSGVIISPNGYIVTNNHVVKGAQNVRVSTTNGTSYTGKVVGTDPLTDLAVVKINATDLPNLPWGDSTRLQPGQLVMAVGNPFEFQFSVTTGVVSALGRQRLSSNQRALGDYIQTDTPINPGNSGGPLVDVRGRVVGINTAIYTPSGAFAGIGFAIPSQIAKKVAEDLIKFGKVSHGYLGVMIEQISPSEMRFFDLSSANGALVGQVEPDSAASHAGLKTGDVIVAINGTPVKTPSDLQQTTSLSPPGTHFTLKVLRNGKPLIFHVVLTSAPKQNQQQVSNQPPATGGFHLGVTVGDLTPDVRQQLQLPDSVHGAVVHTVQPGSAAEDAGLAPGVVIESVNRKPVDSASQLSQVLHSLPPDQAILLRVYADQTSGFRVVHPMQSVH
ncbi:MAG: Do family serine endopeptidase [Terriglobales bacterium]